VVDGTDADHGSVLRIPDALALAYADLRKAKRSFLLSAPDCLGAVLIGS